MELSNKEEDILEKLQMDEQWHRVTRGAKIKETKSTPFKLPTANKFSILSDPSSSISVPPELTSPVNNSSVEKVERKTECEDSNNKNRNSKKKKLTKLRERAKKMKLNEDEDLFLERAIERAEDERTEIAKSDSNCRFKFDVARRDHPPPKPRPSILTRGVRCTFGAARGFVRQALGISKVRFVERSNTIHYFDCLFEFHKKRINGHKQSDSSKGQPRII